jgi:hypothetical protein
MKTGWLSVACLAVVPLIAVFSTSTTLRAANCGNGVVDAGEGCDYGADAACPGACLLNCKCGVAPPSVAVNPVADTYIEKGTEATWDHGRSATFDVDTNPMGIAYLKFDLRSLPAPITHASLVLRCTNSSPDGGTFYPVPSSTWTEGNRTGVDTSSVSGPGLKWTDVDLNRDGTVSPLDVSAWAPDFTRPIATLGAVKNGGVRTVDVTSAFAAGPGLYTLAIRNGSSDGATFASSDSATATARPLLVVTAGPIAAPRCGDGIRSAPEACDGVKDDKACPGQCRSDCTCAPPSTSAPFPCLAAAGPLVTLTGTHTTPYRNYSFKATTKVDVRAATMISSPASYYPLNVAGEPRGCIAGGKVQGTYDRTLTWKQMHNQNNAGVRWTNDDMVADGVRVDNVEDGIRPEGNNFIIRQSWLTYIRDDCVENDHLRSGIIEDSLFDGCYVGISARPSTGIINAGYTGANETLIVRNSLLRLERMPGPNKSTAATGHGQWFKWDALAPSLELHDNIFMTEEWGNSPRTMGPPAKLTKCSNNIMVWLGSGPYPSPLPSCFKVVTDRKVWDNAVAAWKAAHPHVRP